MFSTSRRRVGGKESEGGLTGGEREQGTVGWCGRENRGTVERERDGLAELKRKYHREREENRRRAMRNSLCSFCILCFSSSHTHTRIYIYTCI